MTKVTTPRRFQLGVRKLMLVVASVAVLIVAWRFQRENRDIDRALASYQVESLGRSESPFARRSAAESLGRVDPEDVGRAVAALRVALSDTDPGVRSRSAGSLGAVFHRGVAGSESHVSATIESATRALLAALRDRDAGVRTAAAHALRGLSSSPKRSGVTLPMVLDLPAIVPPLVSALDDPDPAVRSAVALSLGALAPKSGNAPPALLAAMDEDPDPAVRAAAVWALGHRWRDGDAVFLAILERLDRLDRSDRSSASRSLQRVGSVPPRALPALIRCLEERQDVFEADIYAMIIGRLGPGAKAALPALAEVARQQLIAERRLTAIDAMIAIDPESPEAQSLVAPLVDAVLHADRPGNPRAAAHALSRYSSFARTAVTPLRAARGDRNPDVRSLVESILERIELDPES